MKHFLLLLLILPFVSFGQVGIGTTNPSPASILHVDSQIDTNVYGGFMPPKVNIAQRSNIPVTASDDGLLIYLQEGSQRCLQIYNGISLSWENVFCMPVVSTSLVEFDPLNQTVLENVGALDFNFVVTNPSTTNSVTVTVSITEGYVDVLETGPQTFIIPANTSLFTATDLYSVLDDNFAESAESFTLEITTVTGGTLASVGIANSDTLTITDNDSANVQVDLANWDFGGNIGSEVSVNATMVATNITNAIITRGTGIQASGNADRFNANNFTESNLTNAITNNDYFQFTIAPTTGSITLTEIEFNYDKSATGPSTATLRSSLDGFASDIETFTGLNTSNQTIDLTSSGISGQTGLVTFRFYFYGNINASGTGGFEGVGDDLIIRGFFD